MKTEAEIQEANRKAEEIKLERIEQERLAQAEYNKATEEEAEIFAQVRDPALKRWQAFSLPYREKLNKRLMAIDRAEIEALAELRKDWGNCPKCQTPYGRFQVFCSNDKCGMNLVLETKIKGVKDDH